MGTSYGDFFKYPRTPHLFGSKGTEDDKHLSEQESEKILKDSSLIIEEKLDGTNVGIHFSKDGKMVLQCRGHEITEGMHPQYDLFKQWVAVKREALETMLGSRFLLYGEWLYAKHTVFYQKLPHYFFEFDILDKENGDFLSLEKRLRLLEGSGVRTVPVIHQGSITRDELLQLIGPSQYKSKFENPLTNETEDIMEGVYVRTEKDGKVTKRAKLVREAFIEKIKESKHWKHQTMVPNQLDDNVDIWK